MIGASLLLPETMRAVFFETLIGNEHIAPTPTSLDFSRCVSVDIFCFYVPGLGFGVFQVRIMRARPGELGSRGDEGRIAPAGGKRKDFRQISKLWNHANPSSRRGR